VTRLEPEVVKLDMSLVRGIDSNRTQQQFVASISQVCRELGMLVVTEGVETPAERDTLLGLRCDLLQGYLYGRPARTFEAPVF
jgi:EAL domain-containing protein (putative c-di-GMP-specific phosphodiesterase class I)